MNSNTELKSKSIIPLLMVFLALSIIFTTLSYGYGKSSALMECDKFYSDNTEAFILNELQRVKQDNPVYLGYEVDINNLKDKFATLNYSNEVQNESN